MKNLRQVLYMLFLLAPISTIASSPFSKLTIKPNLSISLNKRSLKGLTEQALQTGSSTDPLFDDSNGSLATGYREAVTFENRAFMFVADPFGHIANTDANGCFLYYDENLAFRCSDSKPILQNTWKQSSVGAPGLVFIETDVPGTGWIGDMVRNENINLYQFKPGTNVYNEYRYSFNNEWRLKKAGSDEIADESHAIAGSRIVFVGDNKNTGISKQKGRYRLPALGLGEAPQNSNFTGTALRLYTVNYDKLTDDADEFTWGEPDGTTFSLDQSANRYGDPITADPQGNNFLEFAQYQGGSVNKLVFYPQTYTSTDPANFNSLVFSSRVPRPKTYLKPSDYNTTNATKKYYGILIAGPDVGYSTYHEEGSNSSSLDWSPTKGALWENNFKRLQETPILAKNDGSEAYTQVDYEQIDYYGVDLELAIDYEVAEFIHIFGKSSVSAPVEKIEHTGKFISLKPEATIALRGGVTLGNRNGSIGFLYGFAYDRYKTVVKNFERSGSDVDAIGEDSDTGATYQHVSIVNNKATIKDFVTNREIIANINLSDRTSAFFSTVLSDKKYNVDVPGLTDASALTQKYALGISLNY